MAAVLPSMSPVYRTPRGGGSPTTSEMGTAADDLAAKLVAARVDDRLVPIHPPRHTRHQFAPPFARVGPFLVSSQTSPRLRLNIHQPSRRPPSLM